MTVGCNLSGMTHEEKQAAYACDITYGTNNEFGFDYLRDNMAFAADVITSYSIHYTKLYDFFVLIVISEVNPSLVWGQNDYPLEISYYDFIHYDKRNNFV